MDSKRIFQKLSGDSEISVKNGAELLDRLIKDIVSEATTKYQSQNLEPLNPPETDENLEVPSSLPRNMAFSLPLFIPLLRERIYVCNSSSRQYLVSWISVLDSIPDLELVSFLPDFLDGLFQYLSDPSDDVRVSTSVLLENFLQEIRQAADAEQQQLQQQVQQQLQFAKLEIQQPQHELQHQPQRQQPQQPQEQPQPQPHPQPLQQQQQHPSEPPSYQEREQQEQHTTQLPPERSDEEKTASTEKHPEATRAENDGHGKGTYIPGQGVTVKYDKIVEILIPHLSSPEKDIQRTALRWINEFISIAKDVIIQFAPSIVKAVLPSLAHSVETIATSAMETNKNLQKLILQIPMPREPTESISDSTGRPSQTLSQGGSTGLMRRANRSDIGRSAHDTAAEDPFNYQMMVSNLRLQFLDEHEGTRVASLDWLLMLHKKAPNKVSELLTWVAMIFMGSVF